MKDTVNYFGGILPYVFPLADLESLCEPNIISINVPCLKSAGKGTEGRLSQYASSALLILKCRLTEESFQQGLIPRFLPPFTPPMEVTDPKQLLGLTFGTLSWSGKNTRKKTKIWSLFSHRLWDNSR